MIRSPQMHNRIFQLCYLSKKAKAVILVVGLVVSGALCWSVVLVFLNHVKRGERISPLG